MMQRVQFTDSASCFFTGDGSASILVARSFLFAFNILNPYFFVSSLSKMFHNNRSDSFYNPQFSDGKKTFSALQIFCAILSFFREKNG
jgi:hypothetical protein